ncbi:MULTISPECIES: ATP synthase subunit I [Shouchella]|uniref:ATP synthase protein I n=5 Tax=Bacillaceae TaxID=186817 RepID=A0A060M2L0_9BACI|nr:MULTISPECIES: ATP synthase subunit I [Bacillaceae]RQW18871.1 ATP synthase subunit I [Bacillus sp. C1-1]GAF21517.1 ATP synthase protein I2 [Bacillus sp. JCM 19047]AIC96265.1 ATP synthase protein I [Shouchella lehensis G1]MED4128305.1 ATP synthase subunit I [Shouchella miscanthi]TES46590.1 ATP synthase subunit I [Shouchella lehensis]
MPNKEERTHLIRARMNGYLVYALVILGILIVGYSVTPYHSVFLGLILGFSASFLNLWTTYRNARIIGGNHSPSKWPSMLLASLGFVFRIILALAAVWFSLQFPDHFHLLAVIVGLSLMYLVMLVDLIMKSMKAKEVKE